MFANVKPLRFLIEPGEMFYNTPGWWHTTRALTPSIAVVLSTALAAHDCRSREGRAAPAHLVQGAVRGRVVATYMAGFGIAQTIRESVAGF